MACNGKVVIIGAGVAGLVAASHLLKHGIDDVIVLEADNRIGGRIHTIPYENGTLELGAQWIHGEMGNPLWEYALEHRLIKKEQMQKTGEGRGHYYTENGQEIEPSIVREVQEIMEAADDYCCGFLNNSEAVSDGQTMPESVEEVFQEKFQKYLDECSDSPDTRILKEGLYHWHLKFQCLDNACNSMRQVSATTWGEFEYYEGLHWVNLLSGYQSIIDSICKTIPKHKIITNKCVKLIEWVEQLCSNDSSLPECQQVVNGGDNFAACQQVVNGGDNFAACQQVVNGGDNFAAKVQCEDGTIFSADSVIVTMSLGVLKNCHKVLFKPQLPAAKKRIIETMGFGTLDKIYLVFEKPFWESTDEGFQLVWTNQNDDNLFSDISNGSYPWYKDITGFDVVQSHANILIGWIGRHGAEVMESLPEEEVMDVCTRVLTKFTGLNITKVIRIIRTSWASKPNIRGSYSFRTVQSDKEGVHTKDLAEPILSQHFCENHPVLLFAGEATEVNQFSTANGAFLSGKRVAESIIHHLRHKDCVC